MYLMYFYLLLQLCHVIYLNKNRNIYICRGLQLIFYCEKEKDAVQQTKEEEEKKRGCAQTVTCIPTVQAREIDLQIGH